MIVLTGAAGFIGSVILGYLNKQGITDIVIVDDFKLPVQYKNLLGKEYRALCTSISDLPKEKIEAVIHFGANSSTLEQNWSSIYDTNVRSTRRWAEFAQENNAKFIFASSAAVYGNGNGPLNLYGFSKLTSEKELKNQIVLRLFNVYGPNEYHKDRMASTAYHWYNQLSDTSSLKIFENSEHYHRDFIWVEDVARVVEFFLNNYRPGIYDLGSGISTSFNYIADQLIDIVGGGSKNVIAMPDDLKQQYQKNTIADLSSLDIAGFPVASLTTTSQGLKTYVEYLKNHDYY
jgi:ADP-L-glycero-D-manno-heptose 6-epimerase